jgi:hypothetical protein
VFGDDSMSRKNRMGNGNDLRFIHNVRPAIELSGPRRWRVPMITAGISIALTALMLFAI